MCVFVHVEVLDILESNIRKFMALILFLVLSLCTTYSNVDARSKILPDEQHHFFASDISMVFS